MNLSKIMQEILNFLDKFMEEIKKTGFDVEDYPIDHVAYQASSAEDYDKQKLKFRDYGDLFSENIIGGRRISIYKLLEPIKYKKYIIPALEIIEPKKDQICKSNWEHAEFVVEKSFDQIMQEYPDINWNTGSSNRKNFKHLKIQLTQDMQLKLHHKDILTTVLDERNNK